MRAPKSARRTPAYTPGASGRNGPAVVTNSCTPIQAATARSVKSHQPPSHSMPSTSGRPTAATNRRDAKLVMSNSSGAESTAPARVLLERAPELLRPEVGPVRVGEDVLGVRRLPDEEVRDAALARGSDHEIGI